MTNEELVKLVQDGQRVAIGPLWLQVEGFVKKQANKWTRYAEFEDIVQEGYLIFENIVAAYTPDKGAKFLTWLGNGLTWGWARWITHDMAGFRIPAHIAEKMLQYDNIRKEWAKLNEKAPTDAQLCFLMKCSKSELQTVKDIVKRLRVRSLQERIGEDESMELQDMLADTMDFTDSVLDSYQREELKAVIWPLVDALEDKQAAVLRSRYEQGRTLDATGAALGVSRERCRQLEAKGLRMLRRPKNRKKLQPFYEDVMQSRAMQGTGLGVFTRTWTSATEREMLRHLEPES